MKAKQQELDMEMRHSANRLARSYNAVIAGITAKDPRHVLQMLDAMHREIAELQDIAQTALDFDTITARHAQLDLRYGYAPLQRLNA